jgi:tetratricopeptide (TPR) repeat protein
VKHAAVLGIFLLTLCSCMSTEAEEAWVSSAQAASESAQRASSATELETATRDLSHALNARVPSGIDALHRRIVRQDLAYQLASIAQRRGRLDDALRAADRGLREGTADDIFSANLYIARGHAHEALNHPREAASDYYRALIINEVLLRHAMGDHE